MPSARSPLTVAFDSAAALRTLRAGTGLSQTEFARLVRMSQAGLSKYERGVQSMTMRRLAAVAELAGSRIAVTIETARRGRP